MSIILVEIDAKIDAAGNEATLHYASEGYNHPDAPAFYPARVVSLSGLRRELFTGGSSFGEVRSSEGRLTLANPDGALDALDSYGWGGEIVVRVGAKSLAPSAMTEMFRGVIEEVSASRDTLDLLVSDRTRELLLPVSPARYDGSNSGTSGYESLPEDLEGKTKIRLFGNRTLFQPHLLNRPAQVFGLNHDRDGARTAVASVDRVTVDTGSGFADWTAGTAHTSLAAFEAASPTQGYFDTYLAQGLIKLGGTISSEYLSRVLVSATQGTSDARTVAGLLEALLLDAGVSAGAIDSTTLAALLAANGDATGVVIDSAEEYPAVLNRVAGYAGAYFNPSRSGIYRFGRISAPEDETATLVLRRFNMSSAAKLNEFNLISLRPLANRDTAVPVWRVRARDRAEVAEDTDVLNQFAARELEFDIYFANDADVQSELNRRLALYSTLRRAFEAEVRLTENVAANLELGRVVRVFHPRFSLTSGKNMLLTGITYEVKAARAIKLQLWG